MDRQKATTRAIEALYKANKKRVNQSKLANLLGLSRQNVISARFKNETEFNKSEIDKIKNIYTISDKEFENLIIYYMNMEDEPAGQLKEPSPKYNAKSKSVQMLDDNISSLQTTRQALISEIDQLKKSITDKEKIIELLEEKINSLNK